MTKQTRRGFLKQTSVSLATLGVLTTVPLAASPEVTDVAVSDAAMAELSAAELAGPLIAHVRDLAAGEISLLVGTQEIIYRDPELVLRLLRAMP
jgi:hypothetical protein